MPNETPKSKCCDAGILQLKDGVVCQKCLKVTSINELPKQPYEMPDVIYALKDDYQTFWTPTPIDSFTPYIRKSIHDGGMSLANDIIAKRDNEITKLKSALKECVLSKSCIIHSLTIWMEVVISRLEVTKTFSNSDAKLLQISLRNCIDAAILDNGKATDSAKGLYE